jgi:uroporphyrinogen decarboxylase
MGADMLNPLQPNAAGMNTKIIKELYGDKICFHGGVDTQTVLSRGTIADVEREVQTRICDLAPGGGYICAPSHNIQHGVPVENVLAMYEAIQIHGKYPGLG